MRTTLIAAACPKLSAPGRPSRRPIVTVTVGVSARARTVVAPNSDISIEQQGGALHLVEGSADLMDVVKALNALGATPQDLMSILEALKAAGSLRAELEII